MDHSEGFCDVCIEWALNSSNPYGGRRCENCNSTHAERLTAFRKNMAKINAHIEATKKTLSK